ncbi:MAG: hypothetical protein H7A35_06010 [Planctomycetales bacterium]|nr:hypothetical protein [bacterium]UNM09613.1 MAG: hypothetical protein H7A35_06010 [Planctomycetales bacterium]
MRSLYLIAAIVSTAFVLVNGPRLPWIDAADTVVIFKGFNHGIIGFSYMCSWALVLGGIYQLLLGVVYWDMDTSDHERWQFTLESSGTSRFLAIAGVVCLILGGMWLYFTFSNDFHRWPAGVMSSVAAIFTCLLYWMAFPLMEQVGMDREEIGV